MASFLKSLPTQDTRNNIAPVEPKQTDLHFFAEKAPLPDVQENTNRPSPPQLPPQPPPGLPVNYRQLAHPPTTKDECTMGMLCHLLGLFTSIIGPLIVWLIKKDQSPFIAHHGKEALNFSITVLIYSAVIMVIMFLSAFVTMGLGMLLIFPLYFVFIIGIFVLEILACTAAYRGEWHRYPYTLRLIP